MNRKERQQGSITIEATIGLTAFVFVIVSILCFINLCRAQMIVSLAVDATAREMSQYGYFYDITGLENFGKTLEDLSSDAEKQTNQLIGYTADMMEQISGSLSEVESGAQSAENVFQDMTAGEASVEQMQQTIESIGQNAENIKTNATEFVNVAKQLEQDLKNMDMKSYLKSLGALGAVQGYEAILSQLICAPLAKAMITKHFAAYAPEGYASNWDAADAALRSMGIQDGMDGLNFRMSKMFTPEEPNQIHLVCYYSMELSSLVDLPGDRRMVFCKEAVTDAWMSGFKAAS